jgi:hypothetical protein
MVAQPVVLTKTGGNDLVSVANRLDVQNSLVLASVYILLRIEGVIRIAKEPCLERQKLLSPVFVHLDHGFQVAPDELFNAVHFSPNDPGEAQRPGAPPRLEQ